AGEDQQGGEVQRDGRTERDDAGGLGVGTSGNSQASGRHGRPPDGFRVVAPATLHAVQRGMSQARLERMPVPTAAQVDGQTPAKKSPAGRRGVTRMTGGWGYIRPRILSVSAWRWRASRVNAG